MKPECRMYPTKCVLHLKGILKHRISSLKTKTIFLEIHMKPDIFKDNKRFGVTFYA